MTSATLYAFRRPGRRTHLSHGLTPLCNTRTAATAVQLTPIPIIGGATTRLRNDLFRELDGNACIPCTLIARGMLALYAARDTGVAW